ncbi:MAG: hypothetical protein QXD05_00150 [Candidatus Pacearchaeota archaeon]
MFQRNELTPKTSREEKMAGTSTREAEAQRQLGDLKNFVGDIKSDRYNVLNRFNNYVEPFGYYDITQKLNDIYSGQEEIIKRDINEDIAKQQRNAISSLASRGITGGSILTDIQNSIASDINKNKYNVLGQLGVSKASSLADLMKYINQNKLTQTQLASNIDMANIRNKLGGLSTGYGYQQNLLDVLDDTTWLDDVLGLVKTGTQNAEGIASLLKVLGV